MGDNFQRLADICQAFTNELELARQGSSTSLPFIIHQRSHSPVVEYDQKFQALVIGGTNWESADVVLHPEGDLSVLKRRSGRIRTRFDNKLEFLSFVEKRLTGSRVIAINFAYPLIPLLEDGRLDGKLRSATKEHLFRGLQGVRIGHAIERHIHRKYRTPIKVCVANDTVCLGLAGLRNSMDPACLAGGIVGTGLNFSFFLGPSEIVNLEASNFDKFEQSLSGSWVLEQSANRDAAKFEKETSGAYLFQHFNYLLQQRGLAKRFPLLKDSSRLSAIAESKVADIAELAREVISHSARLVACQIAGITLFKGHDMVFIMEGTLFWQAYMYRTLVEETVQQLVPQYKVQFTHVAQSAIQGAIQLVL